MSRRRQERTGGPVREVITGILAAILFVGVIAIAIGAIIRVSDYLDARRSAPCASTCAPLRVSESSRDYCYCHIPDEVRKR